MNWKIKETEQYFDEEANSFLADRYIKGTCPNCGSDRALAISAKPVAVP
jgi:methionyl-tRNA synthetase